MNNLWHLTGKIQPRSLTESRLRLHYAIQFIAATGSALAEPLQDYSHTSLTWKSDLKVFVGAVIHAIRSFQVALDPVSLISIILDKHGETIATSPLEGKTLVEGMNWHKKQISQLGADAEKIAFLSYPPDDFPDHAIAHGATFNTSEVAGRQELANYYANTHQLLQEIVAETEDASPIHTWSHHFDMATLISIPGKKNGEPITVGVGMSPGDRSYDEPYWYVSPYPYPDTTSLPKLAGGGFWQTQHWVGAVLTASQLTTDSDGAQEEQVRAFLYSAVKASKALLV
ncbi:hypothetical protein [Scytonema millei]|uniref:Uncharacterized protein n=1 Tax=Scytonema millei VB511283 TaxID=1245923 RepID=A0A9X5E3A9_9CYAN|nr:hypothetical protein [Scytonema millei]NHC34223.1 hypothetical protein [Scytonema millei VB511283]